MRPDRAFRTLWRGRELRHLPVSLRPGTRRALRVRLLHGGAATEVTGHDLPASLDPFRIAVTTTAFGAAGPPARGRWQTLVADSGVVAGEMTLDLDEVRRGPAVDLAIYRPSAARNRAASNARRWWSYALAARHARRNRSRPGLRMTPADLRSLDVYYIRPRPVHLVTVAHGDGFNLFPMDLVDFVGEDGIFALALRRTSPSVPFIRDTGAVVFSAVSGVEKKVFYDLGRHHKEPYGGKDALPLPMTRSRALELPVPRDAFGVREMRVVHDLEVGSHTVFLARVVEESAGEPAPRLAHVSALFARSRMARPLELREHR